MFTYADYLAKYGRIMQFNKNKTVPVHRWYSFVEGYSKEFIKSITDEVSKHDIVCLEPFSGSGTTALELQNMGIKCISFEVNPLMYLISRVKLFNNYSSAEVKRWLDYILTRVRVLDLITVESSFPTLYPTGGRRKWNLDLDTGIAIEKLRDTIERISVKEYRDLFLVALAAILLDVSNLYRNGKCLSYKENWENDQLSQKEVFEKFAKKVLQEIIPDITMRETEVNRKSSIGGNYAHLYNADCRTAMSEVVEDSSIDLVITSPPYLNSRDYTDTYMLELKALGFTKTFEEIAALRQKTIRSHVQIKWQDSTVLDNKLLQNTLKKLTATKKGKQWNSSLLDMVRLYFVDMETVFQVLSKKVKTGGRVYFNVSNSAYFGVEINTLEICASIAETAGFTILEIRKARYLKPSAQQKDLIDKLLEGIIVMEKVKADE